MAKAPSGKRKPNISNKVVSFTNIEKSFNDFDMNGNLVSFPRNINVLNGGIDSSTEFHVDYLKKQFKDIARPNLFKIRLNPPKPLQDEWHNNIGLMSLAKSVNFPQISIKEWVYERAGQKLHIPTNEMDYGEVTITFINDSDFNLRTLFNRWQRLAVFNWQTNVGSIPLLALDGEVIIYQYDSELNPTYAIKLTNAWPQTISSIELNQDSENTTEEFSVEFKFTMHEIFKGNVS